MIVVTGATGRTGRRVTEVLLAKGQKVRALGRNARKLEPLVQLGAQRSTGNVEDVRFLTNAFEGASAIYLILPEDLSQQDLRTHQERVSDCYAKAVTNAHVRFVVNLSSIGAQHAQGTGPIVGLHNQEQKLNRVDGLNVLHLRAAYFMENLFMSMAPLRATGTLPGGMRGDAPMPWIATKDIGAYAANRLAARDFSGASTQELHGQRDISMNEAASIVGKAIGKTDVSYVQVPSPALETALLKMGLPKKTAELIIEMWEGANAGLIAPQEARSARNTTPTTLESFVTGAFAPAYLQTA
ncbi:MAG TPA: NmrA family NAD(P)-binding protein [Candidatus Acidoferrales bacterium]|nr:NmrA family NAD(P)-binding protein [Candidatus Acidoferrales bacterium]